MTFAGLSLLTLTLGLAEPPTSELIPTNSRIHKLQIQYKEEQRKQIQRVELCVSRDRGSVWTVSDAVTPDKDHLLLKAPADGEYWVKMVIVFRDGSRDPSDVTKTPPDFKMLIDATPPVVKLNATRLGDEVVLDWSIDDQNPNESATQVVYREAGPVGGEWQPIPPGSIIKRTAKFKPATTGPIVVQVVAEDKVGNQGFAAKELAASTVASSVVPTAGASPTTPKATLPEGSALPPPSLPNGAGPAMPAPSSPLPPPNFEMPTNTPPPSLPPASAPMAPASVTPMNTAPMPVMPAPGPAVPPSAATAPAPFPPTPPASSQGSGPAPTTVPPTAGPAVGQQLPTASSTSPAPLPVVDPNAARPNWNTPPLNPVSGEAPLAAAPPSQPIRFTRFDLDYHLDNGPSGVSRVDLYVTRDEGRTWMKWSEHDGRQSPLKVVLDLPFNQQREGDYGFRLVPVSGAGLSDGAPPSGTPPELRVNVDITPPIIRPFMPTADPNQRNTLTLLWEATDKNFGPTPIAIEWSESPMGPWKAVNAPDVAPSFPAGAGAPLPVAGAPQPVAPTAPALRLPNTGSYAWQLPSNMTTHKVYLKFSAWDAAGNKSEVVTQSPVMVDLVKPKGRILGITAPSAMPGR